MRWWTSYSGEDARPSEHPAGTTRHHTRVSFVTMATVALAGQYGQPHQAAASLAAFCSITTGSSFCRAGVGELRCCFRTSWVVLSSLCSRGPRVRRGKRARDAPITCPPLASLWPQACARWDHRWSAVVDRVDDLACIDSLEVDRRDPEVRVAELPLDDRRWDPFVRHFDGVGVP